MLTDRGRRLEDLYSGPVDRDPGCEECGRSIVTRMGEEITPHVCDSCEDEYKLLQRAGKLVLDGWSIQVVKIEDL